MTYTKILIILVHSSMNLGDRAILDSTIQFFKETIPGAKFFVSSNYPKESHFHTKEFDIIPSPWVLVGKSDNKSNLYQIIHFILGLIWALIAKISYENKRKIPFIIPEDWRRVFQEYMNADIVLGSGGNQFYSSGKFGWPFPLNAMAVWLAHLFNKPFYGLPQSIGPLKRKWEKNILKFLYDKNRLTFFRDHRSYVLAKEICLTRNYYYAPDMAFKPFIESTELKQEIISELGLDPTNNNFGMTVIAPMGLALDGEEVKNYYRIISDIIEMMISEIDCTIYIFRQVFGPTDVENDGLANIQIYNRLSEEARKKVKVVNEEFTPNLLRSLFQEMDLFIASRLHSGIFAISNLTPTVFVGYLSKTMGVLESLGLENWGIELAELTEEKLSKIIRNAWFAREGYKNYLIKIMPEVLDEQIKMIEKIICDYKNKNQ